MINDYSFVGRTRAQGPLQQHRVLSALQVRAPGTRSM